MRFTQPLLAAGLLLSLTTLTAEASLTVYNAAGNTPVVYSSVSNATWTGDANLLGSLISSQGYNTVVNAIIAASPTIYDTPNYFDGSYGNYDGSNLLPYSGAYSITAGDFSSSNYGQTNWFGAQAFTKYLSSINYAGSNQWALPNSGANTQDGYNQTGGQFGQLYYNELNALAYPGTNNSDFGILHDGSWFTSGNAGPFTNAQTNVYWLATEYEPLYWLSWVHAPGPISAWFFVTYNGGEGYLGGYKYQQFYAWAVSPGQVAAVPVPGAVWLFGTGLVGLLGLKRRGHAG
ncbi:hypothetical protein [Methylicorpusculum sp.]|uniref:hypothetical protein n=1 Tax=Methylicorpusculum sp. TaxID=2713644 RepID=UPI002728F163|nr:hypothetical protein [Methylicorpusculum sp.]MDO8844110.1 hypothetical protein [Methylicorpusculum sp.]